VTTEADDVDDASPPGDIVVLEFDMAEEEEEAAAAAVVVVVVVGEIDEEEEEGNEEEEDEDEVEGKRGEGVKDEGEEDVDDEEENERGEEDDVKSDFIFSLPSSSTSPSVPDNSRDTRSFSCSLQTLSAPNKLGYCFINRSVSISAPLFVFFNRIFLLYILPGSASPMAYPPNRTYSTTSVGGSYLTPNLRTSSTSSADCGRKSIHQVE